MRPVSFPRSLWSAALLCSALLLSAAPAQAQTGPAPRQAWKGAYHRVVYDLPARVKATVTRAPGQARVTLNAARLPAGTFSFEVPGDTIQATVTPTGATFASVAGEPVRLHAALLGPAPGNGGVRLVLDVYPAATWQAYQPPAAAPCALGQGGRAVPYQAPAFSSGQVGFYMARLDPKTLQPLVYTANQPDTLFPLASTFKQLTLWAALRDVDAGRLTLNQRFLVTSANRSIEAYRPGQRTLAELAERMIVGSENTAADILQRAVGPERLQAAAQGFGTCDTRVRTATKTMWGAQAGLLNEVYGPDTLAGAQTLFEADEATQAAAVTRANEASLRLSPERILADLDTYFHSPVYSPQLDLYLQNRSTPREWAALVARLFLRSGLSAQSANTFRRLMIDGCCTVKGATYKYWGSKAGSGWRLVTMSGLLQLEGGDTFVYAYFNHGSDVLDSPEIEGQLPDIARYVWATAGRLR